MEHNFCFCRHGVPSRRILVWYHMVPLTLLLYISYVFCVGYHSRYNIWWCCRYVWCVWCIVKTLANIQPTSHLCLSKIIC